MASMTTPGSAATVGETSGSKAIAPTAPLNTTSTSFAAMYTMVHIGLVLFNFTWALPLVIADPTLALLPILPGIATLQAIYLLVCVPLVGGVSTSGKGKKKTNAAGDNGIGFKIVPALLSLILTVFLATPVLYIGLILLGAPLTTHTPHTLLCAAHMAVLSAPGLFFAHGLAAPTWLRIAALDLPVDGVFGAALGTLAGAWLGAVPIPLDWDREWQKWPVTIVAGAYAGWALGMAAGSTVAWGRRIKLN